MFCLKILQGLKKCPFKRNLPDHGRIPYTLSVKLTVSTNLSVFSAKENFWWMKFLETIYASYYIWTLDQFQALLFSDLTVGRLRPYLGTLQTPKKCKFQVPRFKTNRSRDSFIVSHCR